MSRPSWRPIAWFMLVAALTAHSPVTGAGSCDEKAGFDLSVRLCSHCHVIGEYNRLGGIGSTPSFSAMTRLPDYAERMRSFYARRPHPNFTRVPGQAKWTEGPAYVPEFTIETDEIEAILCYLETQKLEE